MGASAPWLEIPWSILDLLRGFKASPLEPISSSVCNGAIMKLLLAIVVPLLSACATSTPIQRFNESPSKFRDGPIVMSHNYPASSVYRVYHQASSGFVPMSSIRGEAEQRAEDFARRQGKKMILLGERTSSPPYILGNFPRIEIVFAVVD
jgi:hypothetical protein